MDRQIYLSNKKPCVRDINSIENCMNKANTYKYYELNLDNYSHNPTRSLA